MICLFKRAEFFMQPEERALLDLPDKAETVRTYFADRKDMIIESLEVSKQESFVRGQRVTGRQA